MALPIVPTVPDPLSATFAADAYVFTQFMADLGNALDEEITRLNALGIGAYNSVSASNLTIGLGSKNLVVDAGKGYAVGQIVMIASTASPANYMIGQVTGYTSATGALVVNVSEVAGSGTLAAWTVSVASLYSEDVGMPVWAPAADASVTYARNGQMCRPSASLTLTPDAAAALGDGFSLLIAPTSGTTTVAGGLGTVESGRASILYSNGAANALISLDKPEAVQIVSVTNASAAASVNFTGLESGYDYRVRFNNVICSAASAGLILRVSTDNGATFLAGATDYATIGSAAGTGSPTTRMLLTSGNVIQNALPYSASGEVLIVNPADATNYKHVRSVLTARYDNAGTPNFIETSYGGMYVGALTAINAFQILLNAGPTITGTFILERIKRSA